MEWTPASREDLVYFVSGPIFENRSWTNTSNAQRLGLRDI